ncbi:5-oxoprolinase subunit PxpA [Luteococcus peritonei]|uniref:5-oxoprolinase subunit A n=1 Tax=Luteococcus peritonei TaxID=88874 RepID=A0ABW4RX95_9ACTN
MSRVIDLNADMGESFGAWQMGQDEDLLEVVTSANIACGFHAGDASTMVRTCSAAARRGVRIGAHVAYRDLAGFGRNFIDVPPAQLRDELVYQIGALCTIARTAGTRVDYVKPHGALYNAIVHHEGQAGAVVQAVAAVNQTLEQPLAILGLPGSAVLAEAERTGIRAVREAFADRAYTADGTLVSRRLEGAVLHDQDQVAARMVELVRSGTVTAVDGSTVTIDVESVCVHGDSPGAVAMARAIRTALEADGMDLRAFA